MPSDPSSLQGFPDTVKGLVELGALIGTAAIALIGYFKPKKQDQGASSDAVALAIAAPGSDANAPGSDANATRLLLEEAKTANDYAFKQMGLLEDIQEELHDGQRKTAQTLEDSNARMARAMQELTDAVRAQRRP